MEYVVLEYHDDEVNSHKYYMVSLLAGEGHDYRVVVKYGRIAGYGRGGTKTSREVFSGFMHHAREVMEGIVTSKIVKGYVVTERGYKTRATHGVLNRQSL